MTSAWASAGNSDPVITRIERQKKNSRRVSVYLDGEFAFGIEEEVAYRNQLAKGNPVSPEFSASLREQSAQVEARRRAERLLSTRMRSEQELRKRLGRAGITDVAIDIVIDDLRRAGLIDDRAFAEAWVIDRMRLRPRARALLLRELHAKGIPRDVARDTVERLMDEESQQDAATSLLSAYISRQTTGDFETVHRRAFGYLQRRGYPVEVIMAAFRARGLLESAANLPPDE